MENHIAIGKIAELKFNIKAIELGFCCSFVSVDTFGYDCIVELNGKMSKVQIKSSFKMDKNKIKVYVQKYNGNYDIFDFDILAYYNFESDVWYLIPNIFLLENNLNSFSLYPYSKKSKYNIYKEAWDIFI